MKPIPKDQKTRARKGRINYLGYRYDEAIEKSLCFHCKNSDGCFKPDTERPKGLMFRPVVFCTNFSELSE